ncbi:MAG: hypothetical protein SGILL_004522, partial [Bacillariaceae sp.]
MDTDTTRKQRIAVVFKHVRSLVYVVSAAVLSLVLSTSSVKYTMKLQTIALLDFSEITPIVAEHAHASTSTSNTRNSSVAHADNNTVTNTSFNATADTGNFIVAHAANNTATNTSFNASFTFTEDTSEPTSTANEDVVKNVPYASICMVVKDEDLYINGKQCARFLLDNNVRVRARDHIAVSLISLVLFSLPPGLLTEFVDYHLGMGFKNIYIYDTSENHTLKEWKQTREHDRVHVVHRLPPSNKDEAKHVQRIVYNECADELRNLTIPPKWVMFLDGDEFLVVRNSSHVHLTDFLEKYVPDGALQISWLVFGTANETHYKPLPVLKRFQWREPVPNINTKTIAVLEHLEDAINPHYVQLKKGYKRRAMDQRSAEPNFGGAQCCLPESRRDTSVAAIHHYKYKSAEEFHYRRCVRGRIYKHVQYSFCKENDLPPGDVFDDSAWEIMKQNNPTYRKFDE